VLHGLDCCPVWPNIARRIHCAKLLFPSSGSKENKKKKNCRSRAFLSDSSQISHCNFADGEGKCLLYTISPPNINPATHSNFFYCNNTENGKAVCANDCPGVDPNAVVVGGTGLVIASATVAAAVASELLAPALGAGTVFAALGLGGISMNRRRNTCPPGQCRALLSQRCCRLVPVSGQQICPSFCS